MVFGYIFPDVEYDDRLGYSLILVLLKEGAGKLKDVLIVNEIAREMQVLINLLYRVRPRDL